MPPEILNILTQFPIVCIVGIALYFYSKKVDEDRTAFWLKWEKRENDFKSEQQKDRDFWATQIKQILVRLDDKIHNR